MVYRQRKILLLVDRNRNTLETPILFESHEECRKYLGYASCASVRQYVLRGWAIDINGSAPAEWQSRGYMQSIAQNSVVFKSAVSSAGSSTVGLARRASNTNKNTLSRKSNMTKYNKSKARRCMYNGNTYESHSALASFLGTTTAEVHRMVMSGIVVDL